MPNDFEIIDGVLKKYRGTDAHIVIPDGVTAIGQNAFKNCAGVTSVVIPDGVTKINGKAFSDCVNLASVAIPDSVTRIGRSAFAFCKSLRSVVIPDGVKKIDNDVFFRCTSLRSVTLPDTVTAIGQGAFDYCKSLTSVTLPDRLKKIGADAFSDCSGITAVNIPDSTTEIESGAFRNCSSLSSIRLPETVKTVGRGAFTGCQGLADSNGFVILRNVLYSYYGRDTEVVIPKGVAIIGKWAFHKCERITSVILPDTVTVLEEWAFGCCSSLSSIRLPDGVTTIENNAFYECAALTSVDVPNSVTEIGHSAFCGCTSLANLSLPEKITEIRRYTVYDCVSVVIPQSVTKIDANAIGPSVTVVCREGSFAHQFCIEKRLTYIFDFQYEAFHGLLPQGFEKLASPFVADEEKPYLFISYSHKDRDRVLIILKELYEAGWKIWYDEGLTIGDSYDETLHEHVENCSAFLLFVTENSLNSVYIKENEIPWAIQYKKPIVKCILDEGRDYAVKAGSVTATVPPSGLEPALHTVSGLTKGAPREAKGVSVVVDPAARTATAGSGFAYCIYTAQDAPTAKAILLDLKNNGCALYDACESGADEERLQSSACLIVFLDKAFFTDKALTDVLTKAYQAGKDIAVCRLQDLRDGDFPRKLAGLDKMHGVNFVHGITADATTNLSRHLQKRGCRNTAVLPGFVYRTSAVGIDIQKYTGIDPSPRIESEYNGIPVIIINHKAFKNCVRLQSLVIPDNVAVIWKNAFQGCVNLTSVTLPDSLMVIGEDPFDQCKSLTAVKVSDSGRRPDKKALEERRQKIGIIVPQICGFAFSGCPSLTSVAVPNGIRKIAGMAFHDCPNLETVTIPAGVTEIKWNAFKDCPKLTVICPRGSYAWKFCKEHQIPVNTTGDTIRPADKKPDKTADQGTIKVSRPGFFGRLFGKK